MKENTLRFLVNSTFTVIDTSALSAHYHSFDLHQLFNIQGIQPSPFDGVEVGDFDLQGKMQYFPVQLDMLKLTYLDEKSIRFQQGESAQMLLKLLAPGVIFSEEMGDADDEDWFGEKLYYGTYGRTPAHLKTDTSEWNSPVFLRSFLQDPLAQRRLRVSTGGCLYPELKEGQLIDLCRTPENHLFVEDEEHLLLGSGLSPVTANHFLRNQYPELDAAFEAIGEPYHSTSSLWDICCYHPKTKLLVEALTSLEAVVSIHNGKEAVNVAPALLNKLTPGLPLYFLILKKK